MSLLASRKLVELFLRAIFRIIVSLGAYFLLMSLLMIWTRDILGNYYPIFYFVFMPVAISGISFFSIRQQLHHLPPNNQKTAIKKTYTEFKLIVIFILLINLTVFILSLLPLFIIEFDIINFTRPFSVISGWFYFSEGIFLCVLSYFIYSRKRKILLKVKTKKISHEFFEPNEIQKVELTNELKTGGIFPEGEIVMVFEKVGYSDSAYARKPFRKWPWRERGKIVLTEKELIFFGKKAKFIIPLSEIHSIQPFIGRGGIRTFKVCEIISGSPKASVIFYGDVNFWASDPPTELELKSMRLMETIQKWYDLWSNE